MIFIGEASVAFGDLEVLTLLAVG
uniref:Paraquat-inducible protein A (Part 2) n=1 Tax=mine drainage metagenome TaxID=410659 RepID=E6QE23_9ZZZZ